MPSKAAIRSARGAADRTPNEAPVEQLVANFPAVQPVSATALPLPANAAKETDGNLAALVAKDFATQTSLAALLAAFQAVVSASALTTLEWSHKKIHDGLMFDVCAEINALANNATQDFLIVAGAKEVHLAWEIKGDTALRTQFYAGTTVSANGAAMTMPNRKIGSGNTPVAAFYTGPTVTTTGTLKCQARDGSATNTGKVGGLIRSEMEWIIPASTLAMLRVTSLSGASASLNFSLQANFYEVA